VTLDDAIKHAVSKVAPQLKGRDAAAVHALIEMAKKVRGVQKPIRQLADAVAPHAPLNQIEMFEK